MLQNIMLSIVALRVLPPRLSKSILLVFHGTQPVLSTSEQLADTVLDPMTFRKADEYNSNNRRVLEVDIFSAS